MCQGASLCRIVVSDNADYYPKDVAVDIVWLHHDKLCFSGHLPLPDNADDNDDPDEYEGGEEDGTDWLDITDFQYLITQLKDMIPDENISVYAPDTVSLLNYCDMNALREAAEKYNEY